MNTKQSQSLQFQGTPSKNESQAQSEVRQNESKEKENLFPNAGEVEAEEKQVNKTSIVNETFEASLGHLKQHFHTKKHLKVYFLLESALTVWKHVFRQKKTPF